MDILFSIIGLGLLVLGAEIIIRGSVSFGRKINISLFAIGVVIVAGGTSLPELASSINAVLNDFSDLALGAVIGSNIANLILVMATTTLIFPIVNINKNQINQAWINIILGIVLIIMTFFYFNFVFGLVAYGRYNLTNMATVKGWSPSVVFVDMIWGGSLTAFSSYFGILLAKKLLL